VNLWATYHGVPEVTLDGDREGLRALVTAVGQPDELVLPLDEPPSALGGQQLESVRIEPSVGEDPRIRFSLRDSALIFSGSSEELARIVGRAISELAEAPESKHGVTAHVHLDPTSDPERRYYSPDSLALVVGFAPAH
jgi:hypothetical protein